ncbi:hypothetical protein HYT25_01510 [Candidatus Pacearchaeota archaeon]|nr:hypothetical protein [Candidatus Pacearchaeota archaeon]
MNKTNKIFIALIVIEAIISIVSFQFEVNYSTPCNAPSYIKPFISNGGLCIQVIDSGKPVLHYLSTDLLILTIISYIIYLIVNKSKRK